MSTCFDGHKFVRTLLFKIFLVYVNVTESCSILTYDKILLIIHFCLGCPCWDSVVAKKFWLMHHFLLFRSCLRLPLYFHLNHCQVVLIFRAYSKCCSLLSICLCLHFMNLFYGWMHNSFNFYTPFSVVLIESMWSSLFASSDI
jgi:hypothetical protein